MDMRRLVAAMVFLLVGVGAQHVHVDGAENECHDEITADISLILDESNSIWPPDFRRLRNFLADLAEQFPISESRVRFSCMTFGRRVWDSFTFDKFDNKAELSQKIRSIEPDHDGSRTYTHSALARFRTHYFPAMRENVTRIAILVTDGGSSIPARTEDQAKLLKQLNVTVLVVGISNQVNDTENRLLASEPADEHYFRINSFQNLTDTLLNKLVNATCKAQQDKEKVCMADVVFTLASMSQNPLGGYSAFDLVNAVVNDQSDPDGVRNVTYGLVPSACQLDVGFSLEVRSNESIAEYLHQKTQEIQTAVDHIQAMRNMIAQEGREKAKKYGIIVIDKPLMNLNETLLQVQQAQEEGIKLIVVSVGKDVPDASIDLIANDHGGAYKVTISDYSPDELDSLTPRIFSLVCGE